ncbi:2-hydroxy-3-oxopropionate reductase [Hahella sp. CCB-MM4]|uniref:NAD(P)-dependent oxidoreductase n=1 Tax=Hahella sp. (strain CCB-MM4) TaxID=1926491 RepID=UPI000B9ACEE3|nr:NAD(P)-dependent oxidoreductase [Hahella sp. CCB-MM4]OZG75127.1 2-hydroxy-3-oxopropionate reductase [Hahella sp. CCB-MM4]
MKPTIAFLGIGLMGKPMTDNLLKAGFPMKLWNRTRSKAEFFADRATIAETPGEAVSGADIIIIMLENGPIVDDVLVGQGVMTEMSPGALIIDMSSIPPATAKKHAKLAMEYGLSYLDAPVSGGTVGAEQASLSIMAGGQELDYERAQEVFNVLGRSTYIGPSGAGQLAKLANQAIVGITIGAVSEALLLAAQGGANPAAVREALLGGFASSRILELHGERMLQRNFEPGATARVQHKDLRMILDEAASSGLQLPLAEQVFAEYDSMLNEGLENVDHSGLLLHLERLNNTQLTPDKG